MSNEWKALTDAQEELGKIRMEHALMKKTLDKIPEFMVFGNWDYKRCLFCKGPRKEHKSGCVRELMKAWG